MEPMSEVFDKPLSTLSFTGADSPSTSSFASIIVNVSSIFSSETSIDTSSTGDTSSTTETCTGDVSTGDASIGDASTRDTSTGVASTVVAVRAVALWTVPSYQHWDYHDHAKAL